MIIVFLITMLFTETFLPFTILQKFLTKGVTKKNRTLNPQNLGWIAI